MPDSDANCPMPCSSGHAIGLFWYQCPASRLLVGPGRNISLLYVITVTHKTVRLGATKTSINLGPVSPTMVNSPVN